MKNKKERSNIGKFFHNVLIDPERKSILRILFELCLYSFKSGKFTKHYFSRFLYRKNNHSDFKDYFSDKELISLWRKFNDKRFESVLENKYLFYQFFSGRGYRLPTLFAYNDNNILQFTNGERRTLHSKEDLKRAIESILDLSESKAIIIKQTFESFGGENIFKIHADDLPLEDEKLEDLFNKIIATSYIFEEYILQHDELDRINNTCVNTIRINTFLTKENKPVILNCFLRVAIGCNYVDNVSSGGIYIGVNHETGLLFPIAYQSLTHGGSIHRQHPVSKVVFENFKLPFFKEAIKLVLKATSEIPSLRLIGWDIAFTNDGPILIEGNARSSLATVEAAFGGYRNKESFKEILEEAGLI
jgi:hypothetical protein